MNLSRHLGCLPFPSNALTCSASSDFNCRVIRCDLLNFHRTHSAKALRMLLMHWSRSVGRNRRSEVRFQQRNVRSWNPAPPVQEHSRLVVSGAHLDHFFQRAAPDCCYDGRLVLIHVLVHQEELLIGRNRWIHKAKERGNVVIVFRKRFYCSL